MINKLGFSVIGFFIYLLLLAILYPGCKPIEIGEPGAMSGSSVPVKKSGELNGDESWLGMIIVESDIIVPRNSILTIGSGTMVKFSKGSSLIVYGGINVEGQVNRAVTLTSQQPKPEPGDWGGIVFDESSLDSRMEYCVVNFHEQIMCSSDSLRLTDSVIAEASVAGIICDSASPTIEDTMITKNAVGIVCMGDSGPTISHNAITANLSDGISCKDSSFATVSYNVISNNRKNGISCSSVAAPEITSNNIIYNGGWAIYNGGRLTSNFIQGNKERGMESVDSSSSLSSNQYYGVENVESPRSSRVRDAGVRREERW